jgi:molybdopterin molybdotransferase
LAVARLTRDGQDLLLLGLPGNAVAAYVLAHLLAIPLLERMAGAPARPPRPLALPAARALQARAGRIDFRRARLIWDDAGACSVDPLPDQGSAMIRSVCDAQALVAVGPAARICAGELLPTYLLCAFESPDPY